MDFQMLPCDIIFIIAKNLEPYDYLNFSKVSKYIRKSLVHGRSIGDSSLIVQHFKEQISTLKCMLKNVLEDPVNIKRYPNSPFYVQLAAVSQDGFLIIYIKDPSEEIKLAAVRQTGHAIQNIKDPSISIQLEAVNQNCYAIKHIKTPSRKVQLSAVRKNPWAIQFIKNPSEEVQLIAVNKNLFTFNIRKSF